MKGVMDRATYLFDGVGGYCPSLQGYEGVIYKSIRI